MMDVGGKRDERKERKMETEKEKTELASKNSVDTKFHKKGILGTPKWFVPRV